jgi:hypothetical protein
MCPVSSEPDGGRCHLRPGALSGRRAASRPRRHRVAPSRVDGRRTIGSHQIREEARNLPFVYEEGNPIKWSEARPRDIQFYSVLSDPNGPTKRHAYTPAIANQPYNAFNEDMISAKAGGSSPYYSYTTTWKTRIVDRYVSPAGAADGLCQGVHLRHPPGLPHPAVLPESRPVGLAQDQLRGTSTGVLSFRTRSGGTRPGSAHPGRRPLIANYSVPSN